MINITDHYQKYTNQCQKQIQTFIKDYHQNDLTIQGFIQTNQEFLSILLFFVLGKQQIFSKQQFLIEFQKLDLQTKQMIQVIMDNHLGFKNQTLTVFQRFKIYSFTVASNYQLFTKTKQLCDFALIHQFFDQLYIDVDFYINENIIIQRNLSYYKLKTFQEKQNIVIGIFQNHPQQQVKGQYNGREANQNYPGLRAKNEKLQQIQPKNQLGAYYINRGAKINKKQGEISLNEMFKLGLIYAILIYFISNS